VSVVGFDDIDLARHVDPPLTTVQQPIRQKGEEAVALLLATIHGGGGDTEHRRLEAQLVVRDSTGRAPAGSKAQGRSGRGARA
jgi:DNA-binding LacI/PurR family transcriptional regulator